MGSSFSGLDKHGNCYSFGVFPVSNSAQQIRPSISTHPSGLTCNACRQQTDVSTAFRQRPAHSYQHGHNTSDITLSTLGTSVTSAEVLDEQPGRADFTWRLRPERLHQSASSPRTLFTQEALQSQVHRVGIVHASQCELVDDNAQGHGVQLSEKCSSWTSDIVNASLTYTTGVANSVSRHVAQFHSLIQKWSNSEIAQLCSQFDFLIRVKNASFASADARPKSPTLEDDLKSLCANGWCCNLRLSYGGSLHGVHSYVLAARSTTFFELLNAVYSLPFPARISACPSSILTLVLPVSLFF
ncbi:unnamed protein product [Dicrocoelium dendriticum]|nr:unnamed protein product [Dicrocoelium dendriticum]